MSEDRTKTIKKTVKIERIAVLAMLTTAAFGTIGRPDITLIGITGFIIISILIIIEALWTHELQLEEIKENTKRGRKWAMYF